MSIWRDELSRGWHDVVSSFIPIDQSIAAGRAVELIDRRLAGANGFQIRAMRRTGSETIVANVVPRSSDCPKFVLKMPLSASAAESLDRNRKALLRLESHGVDGFGRLVPKVVMHASIGVWPYYLETAIDGRSLRLSSDFVGDNGRLKSEMAEAILPLHERTASECVIDEEGFNLIAGEQLAQLRSIASAWDDASRWRQRLSRLEARLRPVFVDRIVPLSWTHGDYWSGNILIDGGGRVTGIVDWDRSTTCDLPLLDVLHLLVYTRRLERRTTPGEEIAEHFVPWSLDADESRIIDGVVERLRLPSDREFLVGAAFIYWLRFTVNNLTRYPLLNRGGKWLTGNVFPVLERCKP